MRDKEELDQHRLGTRKNWSSIELVQEQFEAAESWDKPRNTELGQERAETV